MRKTTDPKERKYLTDREFNTFGRGAIEDAPAELLYGKGALAEAYNVNCYPQYFEGRTGSEIYTKNRTPPVMEPLKLEKHGSAIMRGINVNGIPEISDLGLLYFDWTGNAEGVGAEGYRDVLTKIDMVGGSEGFRILYGVESDVPRHGRDGHGYAVLRDRPSLLDWHDVLGLYVRVEGGRFYTMDGENRIWKEVFMPERHTHDSTLGRERCSFVPNAAGGFLYTLEGIYRWLADENVLVKININSPMAKGSHVVWSEYLDDNLVRDWSGNATALPTDYPSHSYRYEFTGARLRGKGRTEDPSTPADFETPVSEHNFIAPPNPSAFDNTPNGLANFNAAVNKWFEESTGGVWWNLKSPPPRPLINRRWADDVGTITHIGIYRTLDIGSLDIDAPQSSLSPIFNSPNSFGLVYDMPLATVFLGRIDFYYDNDGNRQWIRVIGDDGEFASPRFNELHTQFNMFPADKDDRNNDSDNGLLIITRGDVNSGDGDILVFESVFDDIDSEGDFVIYSNHCDCAFIITLEENNVRWSGGMDINEHDSLVGKSIFLSDGEAYTVLSQSEGVCDINLPAEERPLLTLTRAISGSPAQGTRFGAVVAKLGRHFAVDPVTDETLRPRRNTWYPRTRFRRALPNCNVAASVPGFILSAIEGEAKLYYTTDDTMGGYTHGSHNPIQINEQTVGGITRIEEFPGVAAIMTASETWTWTVGAVIYDPEPAGGLVIAFLEKLNRVDSRTGCAFPRTVQRISGGEIIMATRIGGEVAVVTFNGHQYGPDMLVDTALGMPRNRNRARDARDAVAAYNESAGYIVWMAKPPEYDDGIEHNGIKGVERRVPSYCFRVAVRAPQGGGVTEYGGERWLWPDTGGVTAVTGRGADGAEVTLVEDARTGFLYRIGVAEKWLDKEGLEAAEYAEDPRAGVLFAKYPAVGGYEIPTRAALPIIADGYKWQKHLETHIAMRCWKKEYRGADGFTKDGFKPNHRAGLKIYEDGEIAAEESALRDLNRNGDYAYLKKIDARRIQEVIETTTSAYKISQVLAKVQTSDREALPVDNVPIEVDYQREWRTAVIHLSRNLPCPTYNRVDGAEMEINTFWGGGLYPVPGTVNRVKAPTGKPCEAFWVSTSLHKTIDEDIIDFTVSMWIKPSAQGRLVSFMNSERQVPFMFSIDGEYPHLEITCEYLGSNILRQPIAANVWQHVALRRKVNGAAELMSLFIDGVNTANVTIVRSAQGTVDSIVEDADADAFFDGISPTNTIDEGLTLQKTTDELSGVDIGRDVTLGGGRGLEMFDARLMLSAVSSASIKTYYDAVTRGGEGWLP